MDKRNKQLYSSFHRLSAPEEIKSRIHKKISGRLMQEETVTTPKYEAQPDRGNSIRLKRPFPLAAAAVFGIVAAATVAFLFVSGLKPGISGGTDSIPDIITAEDIPAANGGTVSSNGSMIELGSSLKELEPEFYQAASIDRESAGNVMFLGKDRYLIGIYDKSLRKQSYRLFDPSSGEILLELPANEDSAMTVKDVGGGFTVQIGDSAALYNNDGKKLWDIPETANLEYSDLSRDLTKFCTLADDGEGGYELQLYDVQSGKIVGRYHLDVKAMPYISHGEDKIFLLSKEKETDQYWLHTLDIPTGEIEITTDMSFSQNMAAGVNSSGFISFCLNNDTVIISDGEICYPKKLENALYINSYNYNSRFSDDGKYVVFWDMNYLENEMISCTASVYDTETLEMVWRDIFEYDNSEGFSYYDPDISIDGENMQCYITLSGSDLTTHESVFLNLVGDMTNGYMLGVDDPGIRTLRVEGLGKETVGDAVPIREGFSMGSYDEEYPNYSVEYPLGDGYYLIDLYGMGYYSANYGESSAIYNSNDGSLFTMEEGRFMFYPGGVYIRDLSGLYRYYVYDKDKGLVSSYTISSEKDVLPDVKNCIEFDISEFVEQDMMKYHYESNVYPMFDSEGVLRYYVYDLVTYDIVDGAWAFNDTLTLIYQHNEDGQPDKLIYSGNFSELSEKEEVYTPLYVEWFGTGKLKLDLYNEMFGNNISITFDAETGELELLPVEDSLRTVTVSKDNGCIVYDIIGGRISIYEEGKDVRQADLQLPEKVTDRGYGYKYKSERVSADGEYCLAVYANEDKGETIKRGAKLYITVFNKEGELVYDREFMGGDIMWLNFEIDPFNRQIFVTALESTDDYSGQFWDQYVLDF